MSMHLSIPSYHLITFKGISIYIINLCNVPKKTHQNEYTQNIIHLQHGVHSPKYSFSTQSLIRPISNSSWPREVMLVWSNAKLNSLMNPQTSNTHFSLDYRSGRWKTIKRLLVHNPYHIISYHIMKIKYRSLVKHSGYPSSSL